MSLKRGGAVVGFSTLQYQKLGYSTDEVQEIKDCFDLFDINKTGTIDCIQLKQFMNEQNFQKSNITLYQMINNLANQREKLNFETFLRLISANIGSKDSVQNTRRIFRFIDYQKTGFISIINLRKVMNDLGCKLDENQLQLMIDRADLDNDGLVSQDNFYQIMTQPYNKMQSK